MSHRSTYSDWSESQSQGPEGMSSNLNMLTIAPAKSFAAPTIGMSPSRAQYKLQRVTGSLLVAHLPWIIAGLDNEEWRKWNLAEQRISANIQFENLLEDISQITSDNLSAGATAQQRFLLWFCGFQERGPSDKKDDGNLNEIFALLVLQFLGLRLGMPKMVDMPNPRFRFSSTICGKTRKILNALADLPSLVSSAMELQLKYLSSVLDTAGRLSVDIPPANEDDIRLRRVVALYHNLTAPLRPDPFLNIIHNFRLAAAMLGWYFEGKFALPPSLEELLIHFKMHGLAKEVTDDEPELRRVFSDDKRKMEDFVKPIKLCLFISPFTLLIPWAYWKWAFSDAQLVEIFFCLGSPKPREVEYCEQAIMQAVNDIADGRKFAERAILELLDDLGTKGELLHQEGVKNWFQSQGGFVMNLNSAIQRLREVDSEQAEEQRLITPNVLSTNTSSSLLNTGENADNSQNEDGNIYHCLKRSLPTRIFREV
ncbi:hypothetical protein C8R43DRAFT_242951 [Mycena crocata]|nr:hypothetical protein C8R43DRAFT_242951 [Mycena crocata]